MGNVSKRMVKKGTMSSDRCLKECLGEKLIPFIKKHDALFWPYMVTCHNVCKVAEYLGAEKIDFFKKQNNAPNLSQAGSIERF